jgi:hypothetical protein
MAAPRHDDSSRLSRNTSLVILSILQFRLIQLCHAYGGVVVNKDFSREHLRFREPRFQNELTYASFSDGKIIYSHASKGEKGAASWQILHLTAHMVQWHMNFNTAKAIGFEFFGHRARKFAARDFVAAPVSDLREFLRYELETNRLSIALANHVAPSSLKIRINKFLRQYCAADLQFILTYYSNNRLNGLIPSVEDLERRMIPPKLPTPTEVRFGRLPFVSVPILLGA